MTAPCGRATALVCAAPRLFDSTQGVPCEHIMLLRHDMGLSTFAEEYMSPRWRRQNVAPKRVSECSSTMQL